MDLLGKVFLERSLQQNIGIYGTGEAGKLAALSFKKIGIKIDFFLDSNYEIVGKKICGIQVKNIDEADKNSIIFIAANPKYDVHKRLLAAGIEQWEYIDPEFVHLMSEGFDRERIKSIYKANEAKIHKVYEMLEDKKSKEVFRTILQHRVEHDVLQIQNIYDENQYFGNDVIGKICGNFVDCGAFNGDTFKRFIKQVGKDAYHYYAFEAEEKNYNDFMEYCKKECIDNISIYNLAVYDKAQKVAFLRDTGEKKVSGKAVEIDDTNKAYVKANSIDNVLKNIKIDMITMDIEGAEIHGLCGAYESINKWHPKLAISAYHEIEHLWEIPMLIQKINSNYRFFYRHHRWNMHDTVCYAIPIDSQ